jgi:type IV secretory pathway VirB10-like protein
MGAEIMRGGRRRTAALKIGAFVGALALFSVGCAGKSPPKQPDTAAEHEEMEPIEEVEQENLPPEKPADPEQPQAEKPHGEPSFTPGMSVDEALKAAEHTERMNVDPDALGAPLREPKLYEPCKLTPSSRFTLRVAIWNGRAVGIDVTSKPKNAALESCLRSQIEGITWRAKVKSLNTVEYQL